MALIFNVERWPDIRAELEALHFDHWQEVDSFQEELPLNPDNDKYEAMDASGLLHIISAREDQKLVGYYLSLLAPHLHFKQALHSFCDYYYLLPAYRKGRNAINLFKFVESEMKTRGVIAIVTTSRGKNAKLLKYLGYSEIETVHKKVL